jgi:SAM-dependent methyltransferase
MYSFATRQSNFGRDATLTSLSAIAAADTDTDDDNDTTLVKDQSHIRQAVQDSLKTTGHKYYCTTCAVGFNKQNNYQEHMTGRKHHRVQSERASAYQDFLEDAPTWIDDIHDADNNNNNNHTLLDVHTYWRDSELSTFPHRLSCIDQSLTLKTIDPFLRGRFWRYLRDSFGKHFPEFASIFHHMSLSNPQYLRVKELFETLEAFKITSSIIIMAQDAQVEQKYNIHTVYDLACGHGLLGILLAYRFPTKKIVCVDLEARDSFQAFRSAFDEMGDPFEMQTPLSNLEYREADLLSVESELDSSCFLIAMHACNEANKEVVDMAKGAGAMWAVMPCCIRSKLYLKRASVLDLDSDSRYHLLCGAFAEANDAQLVRAISRDITAKPIIIAGGWRDRSMTGNNDMREKMGRPLIRGRGTMPPL